MDINEFYGNSGLTETRKRAIIKWFNNLTKDKQKMVQELIEDAESETHYINNYDGSYQ